MLLQNLPQGTEFITSIVKIAKKILTEHEEYLLRPEFTKLKYKSHKANYIIEEIWPEISDLIIDEFGTKYSINFESEQGSELKESLIEILLEDELKEKCVNRIKKYFI